MTDHCPCTECAALAARAPGPPADQHVLAQLRFHQSERHRALQNLMLEWRRYVEAHPHGPGRWTPELFAAAKRLVDAYPRTGRRD